MKRSYHIVATQQVHISGYYEPPRDEDFMDSDDEELGSDEEAQMAALHKAQQKGTAPVVDSDDGEEEDSDEEEDSEVEEAPAVVSPKGSPKKNVVKPPIETVKLANEKPAKSKVQEEVESDLEDEEEEFEEEEEEVELTKEEEMAMYCFVAA